MDARRVDLRFFLDALARGEWQFLGGFSGNPLIDLLHGTPEFAIGVTGDSHSHLSTSGVNLFAQDDFHVSRRLTLNFGLRYEYNSPPVESRDRLSVPDLTSASATCSPKPGCQFIQAGTGGVPRGIFSPHRTNFAPRIGLAWRPTGSDRFVIRSAYGIFYDVSVLNIAVAPRFNPPFLNVLVYPNLGTSTIQNIIGPFSVAVTPLPSFESPDYRDGYLQHWNFSVQREIASGLLLDFAYVGSKGSHLPLRLNANQPKPGGKPPYPQFGPFDLYESVGSSSYHSFQFKAQKRVVRGLSFLAAYTFSKSIDDASGIFPSRGDPAFPQDSHNLALDRGLSNFDARHRFALSFLYELPFARGNRWLGGWNLSGIWIMQTGQPFTANRAIDQSGTGSAAVSSSDRPNQIADPFRPVRCLAIPIRPAVKPFLKGAAPPTSSATPQAGSIPALSRRRPASSAARAEIR